jgi:hypothetical protein
MCVIHRRFVNKVKILLKNSQVNQPRWTRRSSQERLKDERVNLAICDNEVICLASQNGYVKAVKELLKDEQVTPAICDNEVICLASQNGT